MLDRMDQTVIDNTDLRDLLESLKAMTNLARQWERFSGEPDSTTDEIESAKAILEQWGEAL
jgi:hypothetical protein